MKFKKPYIDTEQEEVQLGLGILKAPEDIIENAMYTDYIDMDKLQPNEMNHYQTEKIEELAEALKLAEHYRKAGRRKRNVHHYHRRTKMESCKVIERTGRIPGRVSQ